MPKQLIAWHGDESEEYFAKIALATNEQIKAAEMAFGDKSDFKPDPIFKIEGTKGTLNVSGPLSPTGPSALARYFGYGGTGYNDIISACEAFKSAGVTDVQMNANSGGGYVDGCDQAFQAIFSLRDTANITCINRGMVASAMYYLASASNTIESDSISNFTGSIGVKVASWDFKEYYESMGIKERVVVSDNAPNKSPSISDEAGRAEIKEQINAIERIFYMRIAQGRGITTDKIKADFGQGSVLIAYDPDDTQASALSNGMIDGIMGTSHLETLKASAKTPATADNKSESPALNGDSKSQNGSVLVTGKQKMATLAELLAADPQASAEHTAQIASAKQQVTQELEAVQTRRSALASTVMDAEKSYPKTIQKMAGQMMTGEITEESLKVAMQTIDAIREESASEQASAETETTPVIKGQNIDPKTAVTPGIVADEESFEANIARIQAANGVQV